MNKTTQVPALLTLSRVAAVLGVSIPTIYRMAERHELPLSPFGGRMRVITREFEKLVGRDLTVADFPTPSTATQVAETDMPSNAESVSHGQRGAA